MMVYHSRLSSLFDFEKLFTIETCDPSDLADTVSMSCQSVSFPMLDTVGLDLGLTRMC